MSPLWTPNSPTDSLAGMGLVTPKRPRPCWRCELCDTEFPFIHIEAFERHVIKCSKVNEDQIDREIHERKADIMGSDEHLEEFRFKRKQAHEKGIL